MKSFVWIIFYMKLIIINLLCNNNSQARITVCKYREPGLCCLDGSVTVKWSVDRSGYVPGDSIIIKGTTQNDSKHFVHHAHTALFMVSNDFTLHWSQLFFYQALWKKFYVTIIAVICVFWIVFLSLGIVYCRIGSNLGRNLKCKTE